MTCSASNEMTVTTELGEPGTPSNANTARPDLLPQSCQSAEMCSGSEAGSYLRLIDFCKSMSLVYKGDDGDDRVGRARHPVEREYRPS